MQNVRYKIHLAQGCEDSDIDDLIEEHGGEVMLRKDPMHEDRVVVDFTFKDEVAHRNFVNDAEAHDAVSCIDEVKHHYR